jgi:hypothetical protein
VFRIDRQLIDPKLLHLAKRELLQSIDRISQGTKESSVFERQGGLKLSTCYGTIFQAIGDLLEPIAKFPANLPRSSGRIQYPSDPKRLAWHQDLTALDMQDGIIAWVPLDPIDGTRPTLQIGNDSPPVKHKGDMRGFAVATHQDYPVLETLTGLDVGDVCWFGPLTLHRTYSTPDMTNTRHSLDMRFSN